MMLMPSMTAMRDYMRVRIVIRNPPENEDESGRAAGAAAAADEGDVEGGGEGEDVARQLSNEELDDQA